jgi:hypothetical protein
MIDFTPFRVSFDCPLGVRERKYARIAAMGVMAAVLIFGVAGVSVVLNASKSTLAALSNAQPEQPVRMLAREGEDPAGKPCDEQTWPHLEQRCLKAADAKSADRSTPKHGLASQSVSLPSAPFAAGTPQPVSAGPQPQAAMLETTGAAAASEPVAIPAAAAPPEAEAAKPRLSPREARRLQREERRRVQRERREERMRLQRERREEARRVREERKRAPAEARADRGERGQRDGGRVVRRWTEYTYESPAGRSRRVIVIRRGAIDDDFFNTLR